MTRSFDSHSLDSQPVTHTITSFRDAVGLAMQVADEYAFANVAAVLDEAGAVLDLAIAEGIGRTIEPVVSWAADPRTDPAMAGRPRQTLLMTVRPYEIDIVREQDLRLYRRARWTLAGAGLDLVDWIETDGDLFRSYAYITCPGEAWTGDPPADRLGDQASL